MDFQMLLISIRNALQSTHIVVHETWLIECLKYLSVSCKNNFETIHTEVLKQWLLHDLTKISPGCLPQNINSYNIPVLYDCYTLQINIISHIENFVGYDYSKKEKNKAQQQDLENRNLILTMTDGVQDINGFVLEPIKDLWINTAPGCKILIKGPVNFNDSRSLILNDENCKVLGGEVETLMHASCNHTINQLNLLKGKGQALDLTDGRNASRNKRKKSRDKNPKPVKKRESAEVVCISNYSINPDLNNTVIDLTGKQYEDRNTRSSNKNDRSDMPVNKRIKREPPFDVNIGDPHVREFIDLTSNYESSENRRPRARAAEVQLAHYPDISFIIQQPQ